MGRVSRLVVSTVLMGSVALLAQAARAADQGMTQGQQLYTKYCASCHGSDGKGNGPSAAELDPKPANLTLIAKHNGGTFPFYVTMLSIEGRSPDGQNQDTSLPGIGSAHGTAAMPVWGEVFSRQELSKGSSLDLQLQTTGKIMMITEYLQSIQAK
jgi:mono/diheme cytochrome c family protein